MLPEKNLQSDKHSRQEHSETKGSAGNIESRTKEKRRGKLRKEL